MDRLISKLIGVAAQRPLTVTPMLLLAANIIGNANGHDAIPEMVAWQEYVGLVSLAVIAQIKDSFDRWVRAKHGVETTTDSFVMHVDQEHSD